MSRPEPQEPGPTAAGEAPQLVLASASEARRRLLAAAGLSFTVVPAAVDEAELKASLRAEGADAAEAAVTLAELKAARVSMRRPGSLVIGADQVLVCEGRWYDKPADAGEARAQLAALRGRAHELVSAACVAREGAALWRHSERVRLLMREFSDGFLDDYLGRVGAAAMDSVGAYQLEGLGAQLFSRVEGDYFAVLGLPLLPLLEFLRGHRVLAP